MVGSNSAPRRSRFRGAILILAVAVAVAAGCGKPAGYQAPPPPKVTVASPEVKDITQYMDFNGRTEATESVEIRARVPGFLLEPEYVDGSDVKAGQVLYRIDPREYEATVEGAKAMLQAAKAKRGLAEATWKRLDEAAKKGAVSKLEAIQAKAKLDVAEAEIETFVSRVKDAELQLAWTIIRSPIDGRIGRTLVTEGNLVGQGEPTLLTTVVMQDPLHAFFNVSERDLLMLIRRRDPDREIESLSDVPPDERLRMVVVLADGSTYEHAGVLDYSDNTVDPRTGVMRLRVTVPNPDFKIFPGLFVRIRAPYVTKGAILVPELALQRDLAGYFLMTVDDENTVERKNVGVGGRYGAQRVIREGLDVDSRVVVNGLQRARPGIVVDPETAPAAGPKPDGGE